MMGDQVAKVKSAGLLRRIYNRLFRRARAGVVRRKFREFTVRSDADQFIDQQIARGRVCLVHRESWGFRVEVFA